MVNSMQNADIMIVDEDPEDLKYLRDLFRGEGYSVRTANSGEIALASVKAKAPNLVLLDIRMPLIDGYEVCRRIKADPNTQDLSIIFISGLKDKDAIVKGFKAGGSDYISKPFQTEEVLARVDNFLRIYFLQQELDNKALRNENILSETNAGTWEWNVQTGEEVWNEQCAEMIGYTLDELSPISFKMFEELVHPEDFKKVLPKTNKAFIKKTPLYDVEYRMRHKDGRWIWINSRGLVNSWTPDGKPLFVSGIHLDITKRKQFEEDLIQSENKYKLLFEKAPLGYQSLDFDGNLIEVNEQWLNMLGYAREEVIGKWFGEFIPPWQREEFKKRFLVFKAKGWIHTEFEMVRKSGEKLFMSFDGKIGYDAAGVFKQTHSILKDITVERSLEKKLKESEKILLESQRIAHLGSWRLDVETNEVFWTEELYKIYGFDPTIPPPPYTEHMKLFTPKSWDELSTSLDKTKNYGIPYELELETVTKDGNNGWMWVRGEATKNEAGEITGLRGVAQDVTERKSAERELVFQNKEKEKCAGELVIANKELIHQNDEKEKRAAELVIANKELIHQNDEKEKRAAELVIANKELAFQKEEKEKRATELQQSAGLLKTSLGRYKKLLDGTVIAFSTTMEVRDPYTSGHQIRVSKLATAIANKLDIDCDIVEIIRMTGLLHDIGKMYVPAELLSKPSKLSDLEYSMIKVHSEAGYNILKSIDFEGPVAEIVYQHHEKMDGSGYPRQLKGEQILKEARILCVADVVEAMMSNRPYRTALGIDAALEEIERGAGTIYDADCVNTCVKLFRDEGYEI